MKHSSYLHPTPELLTTTAHHDLVPRQKRKIVPEAREWGRSKTSEEAEVGKEEKPKSKLSQKKITQDSGYLHTHGTL
jgi:hypothetical protein